MNVDPHEVQKFESLAHRWWDPDGEFRPLHDINSTRLKYIDDRTAVAGLRVLEVGCGGGILTQSLAELGAVTTGIDVASGPLKVAQLHAIETQMGEKIRYIETTAESFAEVEPESFDVVAALEMLEHVPDYRSTVWALAKLTRPGGTVFLSTINRNAKAYVMAVLGAEYVLNLLPRGTHDYDKFIKPSELASAARDAGLLIKDISGYSYNPLTRGCKLVTNPSVNYLVYAQKP